MHKFFLKIPWWVRKLYPTYLWKMPAKEKVLYLTFDDGPHPEITPWVLSELKSYGAEATFFCIGKNVEQYPGVYQSIVAAGHSTGNHTYSHKNGWKTTDTDYLQDILKASAVIDSKLFRPPYGRIRRRQARAIPMAMGRQEASVVMWDVLSADFDRTVSPEQCAAIVVKHAGPGSLVVFHDSEKAFPNLRYALPQVLDYFSKKGYLFKKL
ncbi:polysaccharide deacetylase family protein [Flavisolibacter nicotianae]|uniref:polysaccharide deacetylase family protein n=1 Tax=Flavisolibacter nicotianae TaxID=2364882 RepID=UPI000EB14781|nr:polysaccharide deacetylase family protein [Flavisolibacter nicotianae]